ncbi:MAG: Mur ligase family protein [Candidatus Komeilibacteria bacterium]
MVQTVQLYKKAKMNVKVVAKKIIPQWIFTIYHWLLAELAALLYRYPSKKMTVIGVTGTNGKSTTVNLLGRCLTEAGFRVGWATTINFKIGSREWLNTAKMTMLGRFQLQKILRQMADANCRFAIIETSSEGIKQYRHLGIDYDVLVFTNLTPEHIEAHGSFANYKTAKLKLFRHLEKTKKKYKKIIANLDDKHAADFLNFHVSDKIGFSLTGKESKLVDNTYQAINIASDANGSHWQIDDRQFHISLVGRFHIYNATTAAVAAKALGIDFKTSANALKKITSIPGRMEFINTGQNFLALIDYAPEPEALKNLYQAIDKIQYKKLIHVLGSCGGGRDRARRPILGQMAATKADIIIITNEDPYDDDPNEIIKEVADGADNVARLSGKKVYQIEDRREAIAKAVSLAKPNDLVLITGKGAEQAICVAGGKKIPWDDRNVLREEIEKLS